MAHIEWGTIADWAAASSAVFAAGAALYIATRDRTERQDERRDAARSQARLVTVSIARPFSVPVDQTPNPGPGPRFPVHVRNFGREPLINVSIVSASIGAYPDARVTVPGSRVSIVPEHSVLTPLATIQFLEPSGEPIPDGYWDAQGTWWPTESDWEKLDVSATVQFTDAQGNTWKRSSSGQLKLVKPHRGGRRG